MSSDQATLKPQKADDDFLDRVMISSMSGIALHRPDHPENIAASALALAKACLAARRGVTPK